MTPEERAAMMSAAQFKLRDLRQDMKHLTAAASSIVTRWEAAVADDWETRYVTEGLIELEEYQP